MDHSVARTAYKIQGNIVPIMLVSHPFVRSLTFKRRKDLSGLGHCLGSVDSSH